LFLSVIRERSRVPNTDAQEPKKPFHPVLKFLFTDPGTMVTKSGNNFTPRLRTIRRRSPGMLFQDVRYALRVLLRNRAFTLVAVLSLAVGIGANSTMFSLADTLLLRPLPVLHPSDVVTVQTKSSHDRPTNFSYRDYVDYR